MRRILVVELSVLPLGTNNTSLSDFIAKAVRAVKNAGVKYKVCPTCTTFEVDELDKAFEIAKVAHLAVLEAGARRVVTSVKIDERLDNPVDMEERVRRIVKKAG